MIHGGENGRETHALRLRFGAKLQALKDNGDPALDASRESLRLKVWDFHAAIVHAVVTAAGESAGMKPLVGQRDVLRCVVA